MKLFETLPHALGNNAPRTHSSRSLYKRHLDRDVPSEKVMRQKNNQVNFDSFKPELCLPIFDTLQTRVVTFSPFPPKIPATQLPLPTRP